MAARLIRRFTEVLGMLDRGRFEQRCNDAALPVFEGAPEK